MYVCKGVEGDLSYPGINILGAIPIIIGLFVLSKDAAGTNPLPLCLSVSLSLSLHIH